MANSCTPSKTDPILILGAGIFGLSTAIYLVDRGYRDVTIFDKQDYERTKYEYFSGCDAASADTNKIIRSAYGAQTEYQTLSGEALVEWRRWNDEIASSSTTVSSGTSTRTVSESMLPEGMTSTGKVFINNGTLSLTTHASLPDFEVATIQNMLAAGQESTQLVTTDPAQVRLAEEKGMGFGIDPFRRKSKGKGYLGVLDTTGGMVVADKACRYALSKAKRLGAKLRLRLGLGEFKEFIYSSSSEGERQIIGIKTADGDTHAAAQLIIACGGWTPSIIPPLDGLCETTAGSVAMLKIPPSSELWNRFSPERFPTYTWNVRDGAEGGIYGFPRDEEGWLKIGYRGTKYTNPKTVVDGDGVGRERSVPVTAYTEEKIEGVPKQALSVIQGFLDEYLPELGDEEIGISVTRLCWYTDSFDNHFVIDRVPGQERLMVATGGSGHAFKYLPILGRYVVDVMEGVGLEREVVRRWKWRAPGEAEEVVNVLGQGTKGARALANVEMVKVDEKPNIDGRAVSRL